MTKSLELAFAEAEKLSDEEQDLLAAEVIASVAEIARHRAFQLSDEQLAELRWRRAEPDPQVLTLEEAEERIRRLRA